MLRRAMWAMARLQSGLPLTAPELARHFEISIRTAHRDFDYLRDEMHVPAEFDRARGTFLLTEPMALVAPVTLCRGELIALFFAEKVLRQYRGTPFEADLASALRKIQELMPEEVSVSPETLENFLSLDIGPTYVPDAQVFAEVLSALRRRRVLLVRYRSLNSGKTTDRRLQPYRVFNHRGDWYVAAFDDRRRAVRDFALHRIRRVTITTEAYEIPADFDGQAYLAHAFAIEKGARPVNVVIRFSPRQARWIRDRQWHATARVEGLIDGGCVLRMRVTGLDEVRRWVLQFGAEAEVLGPRALRDRVADEMKAALLVYGRMPAAGMSGDELAASAQTSGRGLRAAVGGRNEKPRATHGAAR